MKWIEGVIGGELSSFMRLRYNVSAVCQQIPHIVSHSGKRTEQLKYNIASSWQVQILDISPGVADMS